MLSSTVSRLTCVACGIAVSVSAQAAPLTIDFDSLPGMFNFPGTSVPLTSQLSDQFLYSLGISFRSQVKYVAAGNASDVPGLTNKVRSCVATI